MARKDITMSPEELGVFLEEGRTLQVASLHRDGRPHLVPMWYVVEDGKVVFRSFTRSQKIVNLRRDPRLSVLVERGEAYAELRGVMIEGRARLVDDPAYVLVLYGKMAAKYAMVGPEPTVLSPEELEAAFGRHATKNTAVVVEPVRVTSWNHANLGGAY
jgi:PPOX class probable F420-dependent enzyme